MSKKENYHYEHHNTPPKVVLRPNQRYDSRPDDIEVVEENIFNSRNVKKNRPVSSIIPGMYKKYISPPFRQNNKDNDLKIVNINKRALNEGLGTTVNHNRYVMDKVRNPSGYSINHNNYNNQTPQSNKKSYKNSPNKNSNKDLRSVEQIKRQVSPKK